MCANCLANIDEIVDGMDMHLLVAVFDHPTGGRQHVAASKLPGVETISLLRSAIDQLVPADNLPPMFRNGYLLTPRTMMPLTPEIRKLATPFGGVR